MSEITSVSGINSLMVSSDIGDLEGFVLLSKFVPFYQETYAGQCSLYFMVMSGHMKMLDRVLEMNLVKTDLNLQHCLGNCISACIQHGKLAAAKRILPRIKNIGEWRNYHTGSTILHVLAYHADLVMTKLVGAHLKEKNLLTALDVDGNTPLMIALKHSNSTLIEVLSGFKPLKVNFTNVFGNTLGDKESLKA